IALKNLKYLLLFLILYLVFVYIFYPVIWDKPFERIQTAFKVMSHYPWDAPVFFMGKYIRSLNLPWYYVPVWMAITIPVVWQIAFIGGLIVLRYTVLPYPKSWRNEWPIFFVVLWVFVPWLIVVVLN